MKKYHVITVDNHAPFCQIVTIQNNSGDTRTVTLAHSIPQVPLGTTFKAYETTDTSPLPFEMAYSYKINGKRFVNIPHQPITMDGVERFWTKIGLMDSIRLQHDIRQALYRQKIKPALSKIRIYIYCWAIQLSAKTKRPKRGIFITVATHHLQIQSSAAHHHQHR